jgi:hypothetical protein
MDLFSENKSEQAIYLEYTGDKNGQQSSRPKRNWNKKTKR